MRKVFKFLAGTFGNWYPQTYNSGASIMFSLQPTSSMPNYKSVAQEKNNSFMTSTQLSRMTMTPSRNPTLTYSFNRMPSLTTPDMSSTLVNLYKLQMTTPYSEQLTKQGTDLLSKDLSKEREVPPTLNKSNWTEKAQNIMNIGSAIVPRKPLSGLTTTLDAGYDTTAALVGMANPVIGTVMQGVGLATDAARALGLGTDLVTTEDLILDSKFLALSPLGLVNSLGAKKALTINKGLDYLRVRADMGAGYGGLSDTFNTAEKYAGKNIGNLFGQRDRANNKIYNANYDLARLQKIWGKSYLDTAILGTLSDMAFNKENLRMKGGWLDGAISFGRKGMIIEPSKLRMIRHITLSYKPLMYTEAELSEEEIIQFKNGGSFNVIPEGSLHARLHHMEDADGLTKKGIPVVVEKDGGELELQAEIELNEIIFRLEVTNEIEKLMKDGSDNAAIECGKMLVKEIFENTQDRTGLIESLEEPKKGLEEVVKEHRVFQEGGVIEKLTLEDFINLKILERTEAAIKKATTRKTGYKFKNKSWKNCVATATDNYGVPIVLRNSDLASDPKKYGFEELQFGDNTDTLPDGVLILDYNKPNDYTTPGHTIMLVGRTETGAPIYSYSSGGSDPSDMHNSTTNYFFDKWDDRVKPRAYRYIGTPAERAAWEEEYKAMYLEND